MTELPWKEAYREVIRDVLVSIGIFFAISALAGLLGVYVARRAAVQARDITRQLLAFSRKQAIAPKVMNINDLITDRRRTLARLIGEDIDLRFYPEKEIWKIKFDPSQLDKIIINLAINARDAMPNGGKLTIETANTYLDETYFPPYQSYSHQRARQVFGAIRLHRIFLTNRTRLRILRLA